MNGDLYNGSDTNDRYYSSFAGYEPRRVVRWLRPYVCDQEGGSEENLYSWERVASVRPSHTAYLNESEDRLTYDGINHVM